MNAVSEWDAGSNGTRSLSTNLSSARRSAIAALTRPEIIILEPGRRRRRLRLPPDQLEIFLGRSRSNQVVLRDDRVSGRHIRLHLTSDSVAVEDVGSSSGTFVNEQSLVPNERVALRDGDQVRLGRTVIRLVCYKDRLDDLCEQSRIQSTVAEAGFSVTAGQKACTAGPEEEAVSDFKQTSILGTMNQQPACVTHGIQQQEDRGQAVKSIVLGHAIDYRRKALSLECRLWLSGAVLFVICSIAASAL